MREISSRVCCLMYDKVLVIGMTELPRYNVDIENWNGNSGMNQHIGLQKIISKNVLETMMKLNKIVN